jgi:hypothetical protein
MEKLIEEALNKYFKDFKEYHLMILIGFVVIIGLIQMIQGILVSKKIEKFKNMLKKSEIKFSRFSQMQIEALNEVFELLTDFKNHTNLLDKKINNSSPELLKKITTEWIVIHNNVYNTFSRKRHILPKNIKDDFASILEELQKTGNYIKKEKDFSSMFYTDNIGEINFEGDEVERYELEMNIKYYKEEGTLTKTIKNINKIRKQIEVYFENIN